MFTSSRLLNPAVRTERTLRVFTAEWIPESASLSGVIDKAKSLGMHVEFSATLANMRSLPTVQLWGQSGLQREWRGGQLVNAINELSNHTKRSNMAGSLLSIQQSIEKAITNSSWKSLNDLVQVYTPLVNKMMRSGTASNDDIRLKAKAELLVHVNRKDASVDERKVASFLHAGKLVEALDQALQLYGTEFVSFNVSKLDQESFWEAQTNRPMRTTLVLLMQTIGPQHEAVINAKGKLRLLLDAQPSAPLFNKKLYPRRGGLPRRLLNGRWLWEGPHWSIKNKNQIKTGHQNSLFDRVGSA